jgi:hypothetical protein
VVTKSIRTTRSISLRTSESKTSENLKLRLRTTPMAAGTLFCRARSLPSKTRSSRSRAIVTARVRAASSSATARSTATA